MNDYLRPALALLACLMLEACGSHSNSDSRAHAELHDARARALYKPGMGDLMSTLQLRHAKLWYAGQGQNWELVEFELHEIDETFERVVRWHPEEDGIPVAPSLEAHMRAGRDALATSAAKKDPAAFEAAFDQLTRGCNGCHQSMKHGFILIQRPSTEPISNQKWTGESLE